MRTRDPWNVGAHRVDGRYNAWRSGAPGPHAHRSTATQVVDDRRVEVGQQKPSNDPTPVGQLLSTANAQSAPATTSTAPAHQPLGSTNVETTTAGALAAAADRMQRPDATC